MAGLGHRGWSKSPDWRGGLVSDYMSFPGASKVCIPQAAEREHLGRNGKQ